MFRIPALLCTRTRQKEVREYWSGQDPIPPISLLLYDTNGRCDPNLILKGGFNLQGCHEVTQNTSHYDHIGALEITKFLSFSDA